MNRENGIERAQRGSCFSLEERRTFGKATRRRDPLPDMPEDGHKAPSPLIPRKGKKSGAPQLQLAVIDVSRIAIMRLPDILPAISQRAEEEEEEEEGEGNKSWKVLFRRRDG
ncbi:hypothetical protein KM043_012067 [Ampulex compressa]|nr:hypothetical protein KM043_012067 [Ampulex compressa]